MTKQLHDLQHPELQQEKLERLAKSAQQTQQRINKSMQRLDSISHTKTSTNYGKLTSPAATVAHTFKQLGYTFDHEAYASRSVGVTTIPELIKQAGGRSRQILLRENWWQQDIGHFIGTLITEEADKTEIETNVSLIREGNHYTATDHQSGKSWRITRKTASQLRPHAYQLYVPLQQESPRLKDIIKFLLPDIKQDLRAIVTTGALLALLGLLFPLMTALIVDTLIPGSEQTLLLQIGIGLTAASLTLFAFDIVQDRLMLRLEGRTKARFQAAVWDKILKLPTSFFKGYSAGDLNQRIQGLDVVRQALLSLLLSAGITAIFSILYLILLFVYLPQLAIIAISLVIVFSAISFFIGWLQIKYIRQREEISGHLSGMVFQFLQGIVKLRVANAEGRAFARWADSYADERQARISIRKISNNFSAFAGAYQTLALALLFALSVYFANDDISAGVFIAFLVAYAAFQSAFTGLSHALLSILSVMPQFERAKPILEAKTEDNINSSHPGKLTGAIEISHATFAYTKGGEDILKDISITIKAGSKIAIVGSSGSGKSTLLRILLGFEKLNSGIILYDGQDLSTLNLNALRQQIGVVLQNGRVFAGTILENIKGASNCSLQDCEQAISQAGLDNDLQQFPMGLHTPLTEGATTLSGGQRQRILIARALVKNPAILFMDEATSALDNRTQSIITQSLQQLAVTQIVVAHRLSTVIQADKIIVLEQGRVVESGTFEELMQHNGHFAKSAKRQLV